MTTLTELDKENKEGVKVETEIKPTETPKPGKEDWSKELKEINQILKDHPEIKGLFLKKDPNAEQTGTRVEPIINADQPQDSGLIQMSQDELKEKTYEAMLKILEWVDKQPGVENMTYPDLATLMRENKELIIASL